MNHELKKIETELEVTELEAAQTALETLQKRRATVAEETEAAEIALAAAQRAAIDGSGSTGQLTKRRSERDTLRDLLGALDSEVKNAQWEYDRVAADARRDEARAALDICARQRMVLLADKRELAARAREVLCAHLSELDTLHEEVAECVREAREAFDVLHPNVINQTYHNVLPGDERERVEAFLEEMRAAGLDPNILASNIDRGYLNDVLQYSLDPDDDLPRELIAARHANDAPAPFEHSEAHYAALDNRTDTLRGVENEAPTGPIFRGDGTRDYVAESLVNGGRVAGT